MKTLRPQKRSVSPFGLAPAVVDDPFAALKAAIDTVYPAGETSLPAEGEAGQPSPLTTASKLKSAEDVRQLPALIEKIAAAPANDAPELDAVCQFLLRFRETFNKKKIAAAIHETMLVLFDRKTELFMINDGVLFAKERDTLVGRYFAPLFESQPGELSAFVTRWLETENPDRILHFLDFCAGSKNPTFEHYLLFSHPAFARVLSNKAQVRALFDKAKPLLAKISSTDWEKQTRAALEI